MISISNIHLPMYMSRNKRSRTIWKRILKASSIFSMKDSRFITDFTKQECKKEVLRSSMCEQIRLLAFEPVFRFIYPALIGY